MVDSAAVSMAVVGMAGYDLTDDHRRSMQVVT